MAEKACHIVGSATQVGLTQALGLISNMMALILSIAFLPLALFSATHIYSVLKPPKHRPLLFFFSGALILTFGLFVGHALRHDLQSGIIHFTSRYFGEIYAGSHGQPLTYWVVALSLYVIATFLAGFGLAGLGLCFSKRHRNES
jgi:hypothetical protein